MHLYTHLDGTWRHAANKFTHDEDMHGSGMLRRDHDIHRWGFFAEIEASNDDSQMNGIRA